MGGGRGGEGGQGEARVSEFFVFTKGGWGSGGRTGVSELILKESRSKKKKIFVWGRGGGGGGDERAAGGGSEFLLRKNPKLI